MAATPAAEECQKERLEAARPAAEEYQREREVEAVVEGLVERLVGSAQALRRVRRTQHSAELTRHIVGI